MARIRVERCMHMVFRIYQRVMDGGRTMSWYGMIRTSF
jgi:hypothetical protein